MEFRPESTDIYSAGLALHFQITVNIAVTKSISYSRLAAILTTNRFMKLRAQAGKSTPLSIYAQFRRNQHENIQFQY